MCRAWSRANPESQTDKDWYLHLFSAGQPDWNWRNPAVGDYFDGVLRFWFDKGVDGLRIDVAHALFKAEDLPDSPSTGGVVDGLRSNPQVSDQEEVHEVYRRWRTLAEKYQPHRLLVGEVNLEPARAARYTRADEMQQAFAFSFVKLGWDPAAWGDAALNHGFSLAETETEPAAEPWLPVPADCGTHAIELQEQDPESSLALVTNALELRWLLWKNEVFGPNDGGTWRVEAGNLLICERNADFFVAVAMGTEPVQLPAGSVLLSAKPLAEDGWLEPDNAAWVLRD